MPAQVQGTKAQAWRAGTLWGWVLQQELELGPSWWPYPVIAGCAPGLQVVEVGVAWAWGVDM